MTPASAGAGAANRRRRPRPISLYGLLALVVLAPLPIGAMSEWAWATLALGTAAVLCLWSAEAWRGAPSPRLAPFMPALLLFAIALAWAAIQASPLVPEGWHNPIWASVRPLLDVPVAGTISVNPSATVDGIVRLGAYGGILFLALVHGREPGRARLILLAAAGAAGVYAGYGLLVFLGGFETILWYPKTAYIGDLTGPMVNRNSFATYCGLGVLCMAALIQQEFPRRLEPGLPWRERQRIRLGFLTGRGLVYAAGFVALAIALLLTHSRGGLVASLFGLTAFLGLGAIRRATRFRRLVVACLAGGIGAMALLATSGDATLARFLDADMEAEPRIEAYERTLVAIADAPYAGTGLGTYRDVFQMYRTPSIEKPFFRAHNTYLENALELGVPAAVALVGAVAWLGGMCLLGALRRRRDATYPCLGAASTALVGAHALVDFSLQIPAVAALFFMLLGCGCAQSRSSREA